MGAKLGRRGGGGTVKAAAQMTTDDAADWVEKQGAKIRGLNMAKFKAAGITGIALARMSPAQLEDLGVSAEDTAAALTSIKAAFPGGGKHATEITKEEAVDWMENEKVPGLDMAKFRAAGLTATALARMTPAEVQKLGVSAADAAALVIKLKRTFHHVDADGGADDGGADSNDEYDPVFLDDTDHKHARQGGAGGSDGTPTAPSGGGGRSGSGGDRMSFTAAPSQPSHSAPAHAASAPAAVAASPAPAPPPKKQRSPMPRKAPKVPEGPSEEEIEAMEAEQKKAEAELERAKKVKKFGVVRVRKRMRKHKDYDPEAEAAAERKRREMMQLNTNSKMNDMLEAEMAFMTSMQGKSNPPP